MIRLLIIVLFFTRRYEREAVETGVEIGVIAMLSAQSSARASRDRGSQCVGVSEASTAYAPAAEKLRSWPKERCTSVHVR